MIERFRRTLLQGPPIFMRMIPGIIYFSSPTSSIYGTHMMNRMSTLEAIEILVALFDGAW